MATAWLAATGALWNRGIMNRRSVALLSAALLAGLGLVNGVPAAAGPRPTLEPRADSELSVTTRLAGFAAAFHDRGCGLGNGNGWLRLGGLGLRITGRAEPQGLGGAPPRP